MFLYSIVGWCLVDSRVVYLVVLVWGNVGKKLQVLSVFIRIYVGIKYPYPLNSKFRY